MSDIMYDMMRAYGEKTLSNSKIYLYSLLFIGWRSHDSMSKARKSRIQDGDEVRAANYERLCVLFNTFFLAQCFVQH